MTILHTEDMNPAHIDVEDITGDVLAVLDHYDETRDDKTMHQNNDRLNVVVLRAVAAGNPYAPALAAKVLHLDAINYRRDYS